jgi:hypothetical protein
MIRDGWSLDTPFPLCRPMEDCRADLESAGRWLQSCQSLLDLCQRSQVWSHSLPVPDGTDSGLVYTDSLKSYACLSHVWGTKEKYRCDDGLQNIPQTIKDAMSVCSALGVQYLWVDRYCIDQNNTEEGHHLIFNTDKIYQRAHPAIITSARPDPHDGLLGVWTLRGDLSSTYEPAEKRLYRLRTSESKSRYMIQRSRMDVSGDCSLSATSGFQ